MKITITETKTSPNTTSKVYTAIITGNISNEDAETVQNLEVDTIDASNAYDNTLDGFKSIKNARTVICPKSTEILTKFFMSFCPNLETVVIQDYTTYIGERAFCYSEKLKNIYVSPNNPSFSSIEGVLFSKDKKKLIRCPEGILNTYNVPDGVETIGERAFYGCNGLKKITLPPSIKEIGESAFQQCEGLRSINIPDNIHTIRKDTFFGCSLLNNISFPKQLTTIADNAFYGCSDLKQIKLPKTMKSIVKHSFEGCTALDRIIIEKGGLLENSGCAIIDNSNMKVVYFPIKEKEYVISEGIESIGASAFEQTELQSVKIAQSVKKIEQRAFRVCYNLTEIELPHNLHTIEDRAFDSCVNLLKITSKAILPPEIADTTFLFLPIDDCHIYVPKGSIELYKNSNGWKSFKNFHSIQ